MPITSEQLDRVRVYLDDTVQLADLTRHDWRRQTDVVQQIFEVARLFADLGKRVVFVDGHINDFVKMRALDSRDIKTFFNRRFHDAGLKSRRVVVFDTVTTRSMGGKGNGIARLHFHGAFELPEGWTRSDLEKRLRRVFGNAERMGRRQFHVTELDWTKFCSLKGVQAHGPLGKLFYALRHAGSAYRVLGLNEDGRRSRKAPTCRSSNNKASLRLAKGDPSNFNKDVVLCDTKSKQAGKEAFDAWVKAERKKSNPVASGSDKIEPGRRSAAA